MIINLHLNKYELTCIKTVAEHVSGQMWLGQERHQALDEKQQSAAVRTRLLAQRPLARIAPATVG